MSKYKKDEIHHQTAAMDEFEDKISEQNEIQESSTINSVLDIKVDQNEKILLEQ